MTSRDEPEYARFVAAHPEAMLYHSLPYLRLILAVTGAEQRTMLVFDETGSIAGVLPLVARVGPLGEVLNSLPYYGSHGGVLARSHAAEELLVNAYNASVTADGVCAGTVVSNPMASRPARWLHSVTDYRIGQFTPIAYTERHAEQLMRLYHGKTRNMVRKAEKMCIETDEENDMLEFLMEAHEENASLAGRRAKTRSFFENFPALFGTGAEYKIFVARFRREPVAALLLLYFRDIVEYYMPASRAAHRDKQPLSLLVYHAMTEASQRGYRVWNWGGTWPSQQSLHRFKKRWGAYDVRYTYYTQVNDKLSSSDGQELLQSYPDFFVIPFQKPSTPS